MREKEMTDLVEDIQEKAEEYNYSRPLDIWRVSDHPEVREVISLLFEEMKSKGLVNKRYANKLRRNLLAVVLDLYVAYLSDPRLYIGYSRDRNKYRKGSRYKALFLSYQLLIKSIDFLIDNQYAEGPKGYRHPSAPLKSRTARLRATEKLIKLFKEKQVTPRMVRKDEYEPLIILKDKDGNVIDYEETEDTRRMTENLKAINKALDNWAILLYITDEELKKLNERLAKDPNKGPIDFTNKRLHRIFNNGSWNQGGRFFGGWWQNIPREYRVHIRLDNKHVVECDYSGLHINMLYALEKLPMPKGDVYHLDGYSNDPTFRRFVKQLVLILVNADSREKARKAIHYAVHQEKSLELPPEIPSTKQSDLDPVIDALERKHKKIKHYFCTGKGIDLQNLDSKMAETVMMHFVRPSGLGYAILPLHDSFIVHHGLEETLKKKMKAAFRKMFGRSINVDLKYNSLEAWKKEQRPKPPGKRFFNMTLTAILAEQARYSTYHTLLREHFNSRASSSPKDQEQDEDQIPF